MPRTTTPRRPRAAAVTVVLSGLVLAGAVGTAAPASAAHGDSRPDRVRIDRVDRPDHPDKGASKSVVATVDDLTVSPGSAGWAFSGSAGRLLERQTRALGMWRDGVATTQLKVPARVAGTAGAQLSITAGADVCQGPAAMTVTVDGVEVAQRSVDADLAVYPLPGALAAGVHEVQVGYSGDLVTSDCDRSLKVYAVTASRTDVAPPPSLTFGPPSLLLGDAATGYWRDLRHGGAEAVLFRPGTASRAFTSPGSTDAAVVVTASGSDCEGQAVFDTTLDGVDLGRTEVTDTATPYRLPVGAVAAGAHTVRVSYVNDHFSDSCDRNLSLRSVSVVG